MSLRFAICSPLRFNDVLAMRPDCFGRNAKSAASSAEHSIYYHKAARASHLSKPRADLYFETQRKRANQVLGRAKRNGIRNSVLRIVVLTFSIVC